jgi:hypothetical protein
MLKNAAVKEADSIAEETSSSEEELLGNSSQPQQPTLPLRSIATGLPLARVTKDLHDDSLYGNSTERQVPTSFKNNDLLKHPIPKTAAFKS